MSIATELQNYETYLTNAYNKAQEKGAIIPQNKNLQNLTNCIDSIYIPYTSVEYLESTGTQYINTGIVPKTNTRMILKFASRDVTSECYNGWITGSGALFSAGHGSNSSDTYFQCIVSSSWSWTASTTPIDTNIHTWDISNSAKIFDGTNFGTGNCGNASSGQTLYIFAQHTSWSPYTNYAKERIYYCKIYEGDTLVRDFIPVLDKTNVPCLLDKVTGTFYYNQGTGTFNYGIINSTNSLNTASLMNTGSLVDMGDRAELTSLETTEEKTEGSGDIL